jgi:hypothetical protein
MAHDYRNTHLRTCEKLLRQRDYYVALAKTWETNAAQDPDPASARIIRSKVELLLRCAKDFKFIADRAMRNLPVEDIVHVNELVSPSPIATKAKAA